MIKLLIFIIGLISGISIHYIVSPAVESESIEESQASTIPNEKELLRQIAALKQKSDGYNGCVGSSNMNRNNNMRSISNTENESSNESQSESHYENENENESSSSGAWVNESEQQYLETENLEEQFEQGQILEY